MSVPGYVNIFWNIFIFKEHLNVSMTTLFHNDEQLYNFGKEKLN